MKPRDFVYHRPASVSEILELLDEFGDDAKILAGGQSLIPMLNFRIASPGHLIDINNVPGLDNLSLGDDGLRLGATVRQRTVENSPEVVLSYPIMSRALLQVAHPQIRNRGTICGSVAHADSSAELPSVMVVLGAELVARSHRGDRTISVDEFFEFHLGTALKSDEFLAEIRLPRLARRAFGTFVEVARRTGDFALVGVAAQVTIDDDGRVTDSRIACSGVSQVPLLLAEVAQLTIGTDLRDDLLMEIDHMVRGMIDPPDDVHASTAYRRVVAGAIVRRALTQLRDEARSAHV